MKNLRGVDLNLLPILRALLRESSVTRAAAALSITQPSVSQALGRLRALFDDPLLVQIGRTMRLTPRAEELRVLADQACASFEMLLSTSIFDPERAERAFSIAAVDYTAIILGRELVPLLKREAPGIQVSFVDLRITIREQLLDGSLDMAVTARFPALNKGLSIWDGFLEAQVCVASLDHPLADRDSISVAELAQHRRLNIDLSSYQLPELGSDHPSEPVRVGPSHLLALPLLVAETGGVAVVSEALGQLATRYAPLKLIRLTETVKPINVCIAWSPVNDADPAHQWLRGQIGEILSRLPLYAPAPAEPRWHLTRSPR